MTTQTEQVHLVNIISIAEDKLQQNFNFILKRLNEHDKMLEKNAENIENYSITSTTRLRDNMRANQHRFLELKEEMMNMQEHINRVQNRSTENLNEIDELKQEIHIMKESLLNQKLCLQEKIEVQANDLNIFDEKMQTTEYNIEKINEELIKKQSILEAERMGKKIEEVNQKNNFLDCDIKLMQHKMQKMEIISQKNQRQQAKRDADMMKDFEERVKRMTQKNNFQPGSSFGNDFFEDKEKNWNPKQDEEERRPSLFSFEKNINQMAGKITTIQQQMKDISDSIKMLKQSTRKKHQSSSDGILQKFNELKPQIIKLWTKCDALQDRLIFTDKKVEQKGKIINALVQTQKENSWMKMDEKIKIFQTEVYTFIKDIKVKVEGKIGIQEYQKNSQSVESKIKQINDTLFLKSDKLEVKKALLFLESKIKQIILVISEDEENEKDALLTKKQLKCISCDKDVEKITGVNVNGKGNWDSLPYRDHPPEVLGRFGMTSFGSLAKKLKKLQSQDLPILSKKTTNVSPKNQ